ncbi:hypothetical protein BDV95DRAFT_607590 [Massariosphaeria phaeospora]|uniref:Uncharacterized protein n=1 Tax=Massariosphaeria phaeospora TaxID=100035 RepID=A0A7C8M9U8_9PLEO|nr:hypothetical protein BDV95DRAFT_607590 [Massariosphaeria phaeospora]
MPNPILTIPVDAGLWVFLALILSALVHIAMQQKRALDSLHALIFPISLPPFYHPRTVYAVPPPNAKPDAVPAPADAPQDRTALEPVVPLFELPGATMPADVIEPLDAAPEPRFIAPDVGWYRPALPTLTPDSTAANGTVEHKRRRQHAPHRRRGYYVGLDAFEREPHSDDLSSDDAHNYHSSLPPWPSHISPADKRNGLAPKRPINPAVPGITTLGRDKINPSKLPGKNNTPRVTRAPPARPSRFAQNQVRGVDRTPQPVLGNNNGLGGGGRGNGGADTVGVGDANGGGARAADARQGGGRAEGADAEGEGEEGEKEQEQEKQDGEKDGSEKETGNGQDGKKSEASLSVLNRLLRSVTYQLLVPEQPAIKRQSRHALNMEVLYTATYEYITYTSAVMPHST